MAVGKINMVSQNFFVVVAFIDLTQLKHRIQKCVFPNTKSGFQYPVSCAKRHEYYRGKLRGVRALFSVHSCDNCRREHCSLSPLFDLTMINCKTV